MAVLSDLTQADQATVNAAMAAYNAATTTNGSSAPVLVFGGANSDSQVQAFEALKAVNAIDITGGFLAYDFIGAAVGNVVPIASAYIPSGGNQSTLAASLEAALVAYFASVEA